MIAVDLFAGLGGMSLGATMAGHEVALAANHWPAAVRVHEQNHPETHHWTQDLHQADWSQVPGHDLLLASPACQGHAWARGKDRPHHDASRSTAWAVVACAEYHRPEFILVENVVEMKDWVLFDTWRSALSALGYSTSIHILDAADHGVPQSRVRMFILGSRSKKPPILNLEKKDHVPAPVDWTSGRWSMIRKPGRAARTLERVRRGRALHGDRFLMPYYGRSRGGRCPSRPLGTVTTRDRWAAVDGDRMRMLTVPEYKAAMGFPSSYAVPSTPKKLGVHLLGNAVCPPVVRDVLEGLAG